MSTQRIEPAVRYWHREMSLARSRTDSGDRAPMPLQGLLGFAECARRHCLLLALLGFQLVGCAGEVPFGIPVTPTSPDANVQSDEKACGTIARVGSNSFHGRTYMACMISKGYRTYVTIGP
jgi:hypothetical protein